MPTTTLSQSRSHRRINDPGIIADCHCGDEYETEYSESIETHTATSIDGSNQKSTDIPHDESVDSIPDECENDYYNPTIDAYIRQNMHTDEYDEDYEEERAIDFTPGADKLQDSFTDEELLNIQKRDDIDQIQAEASWERTRFSQSIDTRHQQSIDKLPQQSIDINNTTSINNRLAASIDTNPPRPNTIKSQSDFHNREEIDQLVEGIYRALETTEERHWKLQRRGLMGDVMTSIFQWTLPSVH
ncbi:hypothetical protein F2Q69_00052860 [Brassica cretica]|uniref:Uncharacterized protein n=1 Tax=Brassica cretica TaxID=69181 RepID=A0A8S9MRN1_BRACR|nr:hypothetical protein F2Q69_00052860 [Brassica cretica]